MYSQFCLPLCYSRVCVYTLCVAVLLKLKKGELQIIYFVFLFAILLLFSKNNKQAQAKNSNKILKRDSCSHCVPSSPSPTLSTVMCLVLSLLDIFSVCRNVLCFFPPILYAHLQYSRPTVLCFAFLLIIMLHIPFKMSDFSTFWTYCNLMGTYIEFIISCYYKSY